MGKRIWSRFIIDWLPKIHGQNLNLKGIKMKISKKISGLLFSATAVISTSAFAALPASVMPSIAAIQTDGQAIFDLVFPVVAVFVGLGIVIALFKRFTSKI